MFINGKTLLDMTPIEDMVPEKTRFEGTSYGLAEAGYDIRIKQRILYINDAFGERIVISDDGEDKVFHGNFVLASTIERFTMPNNLVGNVKDKSTWARQGISVFNTVIEPGWSGFLTLEIVFHGSQNLEIIPGQGIAQVLFGELSEQGDYGDGKYQNAPDKPEEAKS